MEKARIYKYYSNVVVEDFLILYNCNNIMQLPKINRIILSTSSKSYILDKKGIVNAFAACFLLSGQKGVFTRAGKSVAGFKLREGSLIGCKVTTRRSRMYVLLEKFLTFVLPRIQDQLKNLREGTDFIKQRSFRFASIASSLPTSFAGKAFWPIVAWPTYLTSKGELGNSSCFGVNNPKLLPESETFFELFDLIKGLPCSALFFRATLKNKGS